MDFIKLFDRSSSRHNWSIISVKARRLITVMGQRHQLFVIANINGRYRALAVVHHQCLYGIYVLEKGLHIVKLFEANQPGLRRELRKAEQLDWSRDIYDENGDAREVVFPLVSTILQVGTSLNEKNSYASNVIHLEINTAYNGGDNNDGISVFDITDPANPRYGLLFLHETTPYNSAREVEDEDAKHEEPNYTPGLEILDPETYVKTYGSLCRQDSHTITECQALPKLTVGSLRSAWPDVSWSSECDETHNDVPPKSKPLKESSLSRVLDAAFESNQTDCSWLDQAEDIPGFIPALEARLSEHPSLIRRPQRRCCSVGFFDIAK